EGVAADAGRGTGIPRERIVAIHNPVLTPAFRERAGARIEHPWLAAGGPPVVIGAGRLRPQKDFATLIRAFARVRASRRVRLLILGEGPLRGALQRLPGEPGRAADARGTGRVAS